MYAVATEKQKSICVAVQQSVARYKTLTHAQWNSEPRSACWQLSHCERYSYFWYKRIVIALRASHITHAASL